MTKEFRSPIWLKVATAIAAVLFVLAFVAIVRLQTSMVMVAGSFALAMFAIAAVCAVWLDRVTLSDSQIVVVSNLRRRVYPRHAVVAVSWAKGCPVKIQCADGHWEALPPVGSSSQSVGKTVQAWIRATGDTI